MIMFTSRHVRFALIALFLTLIIFNFSSANVQKKVKVFVSILPQAYFVERIGGDNVDISVMIGQGQSPAVYEPTPQQMTRLAESDVYFRIGVPFEKHLLKKLSGVLKDLNIVDICRGVELRSMDCGHDHEHGTADPHVWLDPRIVKILSDNIFKALRSIDPANEAYYINNLHDFHLDLDNIDKKISDILAPYKGREFFVYHPVFGYFGDRYGLKQAAVEIDNKEPGARQLASLIDLAKIKKVSTIFVQPQFSTKSAETIAAAIGGKIVQMDPLAYDYLRNLKDMAHKLAEGFNDR